MSLTQLINRPCMILRRSASGEINDYGDEIPSVETIAGVCELQQQKRAEQGDMGEVSDSTWILILPGDTEIETGDAVVVDGETYELVGEPWAARNPRIQTVSHIEATVRRTAGSEETGS